MVRTTVQWWLALLLVALVSGCEAETKVRKASTQVMLRIYNNDQALLSAMKELRTGLYVRQGSTWDKRAQTVLAIGDLTWPVDVPVLPPSSDSFGSLR